MVETYAKSNNQQTDFTATEEGIQGVLEKQGSLQGGEHNVKQHARFEGVDTCDQFSVLAPLDTIECPRTTIVQVVVNAIGLESGEKNVEKQQLNGNDGSEGFVLRQPRRKRIVEVDAHSRKHQIGITDSHDMFENLPAINHSFPVHMDQSISSPMVPRDLLHHMIDPSSMESVLPGLGIHDEPIPIFYGENKYKNEAFGEPFPPDADIWTNLPGSSLDGSFIREVNHSNATQYESVKATQNARGNNSPDELPLDVDLCTEQVEFWVSKLKSAASGQCKSYAETNVLLQKRLAELTEINRQYEILRQEEQLKRKREISRYDRELHLMGGLLSEYRKAMKETQNYSAKRGRHSQQPEESLYRDHPDGNGTVITVAEWEKLMQERQNRESCMSIQAMMDGFQHECIDKLEEHLPKLDTLCSRVSGCGDSLNLLKAKASRS